MCLFLPNWMQLQYDSEISILVASQVTSVYLRLQVISRAAMKEGFAELCGAICEEIVEIEKCSTQAVCNIIRGIYVSAVEQPLLQLSLPTMLRKTVTNRICKIRHLANNSDRNFFCNANPILPSFHNHHYNFSRPHHHCTCFNFTTLILPYPVPLHQLDKGRAPYSQQAKAWALRGNVSKNKIKALASWAIFWGTVTRSVYNPPKLLHRSAMCVYGPGMYCFSLLKCLHHTWQNPTPAVHVSSLHPALHLNVSSWCNCQEIWKFKFKVNRFEQQELYGFINSTTTCFYSIFRAYIGIYMERLQESNVLNSGPIGYVSQAWEDDVGLC